MGQQASPTTIDPIETARKLQQFMIEANQPAISSLESSVPETSARFATERTRLAGEKEPLSQRYKNLLDEITRREGVDVSAQERVKSREFGRRGIPLSSGLFDVERQEAVSPIRQFYTGQYRETGLAREQSLKAIEDLIAQLTGQETEAVRNIRNAIAQLQRGEPGTAIQGALGFSQQQQQAQQSAAELALRKILGEQELGLARERFEFEKAQPTTNPFVTLGEGSTLFNLLTGQPLYTAPKTYKEAAGVGDWQ